MKKSKNICVAIETTDTYLGLALLSYEPRTGATRVLAHYFKNKKLKQSDSLIPVLDQMMKAKKISPKNISLVAVDVGPGSFTGVRVGVAVARALGQGLNCPLVGVSSLEILAHQIDPAKKKGPYRVACIGALSTEVYFAAYRRNGVGFREIQQPKWGSSAEFSTFLSKKLNKKTFDMVGNHTHKINSVLPTSVLSRWTQENVVPHPAALGEIAIRRYCRLKRKSNFSYEKVVPLYLQPSWAER